MSHRNSNGNSKKESRSYFRSLYSQELAKGLVQNQQQFNTHLRSFLRKQSGTWGAYRALPGELSVEIVFQTSHLQWVFPRVQEDRLIFSLADTFVTGAFGIQEPPADSVAVPLRQVQGLLVPGLAFSKNGSRLGKGKGFYDKALQDFQGLKVGVCFDFQISPTQIPTEAHDMKVDFLLSESGLTDCRMYQE